MRHLDLFSGIGGFALAADRVWPGIEHTFVEIDPFCQAILKKHWPKAEIYGDIRTFADTAGEQTLASKPGGLHAEPSIPHTGTFDLLTGGFPCQPFSHAGRRKGTADDRYLWPEMFAVIERTLPRWVIAENVRGLVTWNEGLVLEKCCTDLESLGYEVQPIVIPACALGAPHRRDRVWIFAHHVSQGQQGDGEARTQIEGRSGLSHRAGDTEGRDSWGTDWPTVAARLCRMDDGLPEGISRPRGWRNAALKAYGNAIVSQVAEEIMRTLTHPVTSTNMTDTSYDEKMVAETRYDNFIQYTPTQGWLTLADACKVMRRAVESSRLKAIEACIAAIPPEETWGSNGSTHEDQSVDESLYHDQLKVLGYNALRNKALHALSLLK